MQTLTENETEERPITMKKTPAIVHLLIWTVDHPSGEHTENQELFTSLKKARARASEIVSVWSSKVGSTSTGSIRSGRVFIDHEGTSVSIAVSTITDAPIVQTLWRYWQERGDSR